MGVDPDPDLDLDPENRKVRRRADVLRNGRGTEEKTSVTSNLRSGALLEDFGFFLNSRAQKVILPKIGFRESRKICVSIEK